MSAQTSFVFRGRGGRRPGAGRKPAGARARVSHAARPSVSRHTPLHVTLRMEGGLPTLRQQALVGVVRGALRAGKERFGLRVVHYSIQRDHLHLVVEAADRRALTRGMHGLGVRVARGVNRMLDKTGRVLGDRYHARALRTPREVRNVLAYVLLNARRHGRVGPDAWDLAIERDRLRRLARRGARARRRAGSPRGDRRHPRATARLVAHDRLAQARPHRSGVDARSAPNASVTANGAPRRRE